VCVFNSTQIIHPPLPSALAAGGRCGAMCPPTIHAGCATSRPHPLRAQRTVNLISQETRVTRSLRTIKRLSCRTSQIMHSLELIAWQTSHTSCRPGCHPELLRPNDRLELRPATVAYNFVV